MNSKNYHTNYYNRLNEYNNYENPFKFNNSLLIIYKDTVLFKNREKYNKYENQYLVSDHILKINTNTSLLNERKKNQNYVNLEKNNKQSIKNFDNTILINERKRNIHYENIYENKRLKADMVRTSSYGCKLYNNNTYFILNTINNPIYAKDFYLNDLNDLNDSDSDNDSINNKENQLWYNKLLVNKRHKSFVNIDNNLQVNKKKLVRSKSFIY